MQRDHLEGLVTRTAFCAQLSITTRTAHRWMVANYGPVPRRLGPGKGRLYYVQTEIDAFATQLKSLAAVVA